MKSTRGNIFTIITLIISYIKTEEIKEFIDAINTLREENGLNKLLEDDFLSSIADENIKKIANTEVMPTDPEEQNRDVQEKLNKCGYGFVSELNELELREESPGYSAAFTDIKAIEEDKNPLFNPGYDRIGLGVASVEGKDRRYWALIFVNTSQDTDSSKEKDNENKTNSSEDKEDSDAN
ncbi:hypothetical protein EDEG_01231 [Edhazardia aedis USNM 41457]|uniref:SCP domain-containing protein n=1 Tax=Edhazardia aedis (strain USNM 41457) TaxID=1003232 RepID=J8ZY47_EDHAE|nr:hypothetical protein EDEG_01231 [Edhazardia aedis USNM 41457]|eukprot:EJW04548.1 hypothetical protein EDEG_01231 [Edhazardia aedis USNM 41457]